MPDPALVIIARAPEGGQVKTRLAAGIGNVAALAAYRALLAVVVRTQAAWRGPVLLAATGEPTAWVGTGLEHLPRQAQPEGGLGARIAAALTWGVATTGRAIAIGTDCPGLHPRHLHALAAQLDHVPVVFGPALDGGYWAVGVNGSAAIPLMTGSDLPWSQPLLLTTSQARLDAAAIRHATGDILADCDDMHDLTAAIAAGHLPPMDSLP